MSTDDRVFTTKDIELAAFLKAKDRRVVDVRKNEANKTVFIFDNADAAIQKLSLDFYNHDDTVSASKLLWCFGQVKQMLFDPNLERQPSQARSRA